jgi:hypothetical protein
VNPHQGLNPLAELEITKTKLKTIKGEKFRFVKCDDRDTVRVRMSVVDKNERGDYGLAIFKNEVLN